MALVYAEQKLYEKAEPLYLRAIQIIEKSKGPEHPSLVTYMNNLANLYLEEGKREPARLFFEKAIVIGVKRLGATHPTVLTVKENLRML
ncbi:hypothetical protein LDG_7048 [Legionella drancourtii LLAP12]|uniref:Uncharacterized protein n=1 Tax=Legionella drancourtii LLAP12 TaxID=658187 RepID=G9EP66_9GAMM|nr:hypothetical protein LDG_7048 [Legionella drancourtii LLAP12]